jgi:signal transduction histidine kinase
VRADAARIVQVLANLLRNAIKFRSPDRPPRVHISAQRAERAWRLTVRDNGIGIDPRFAGRIFVLFQRLNQRGAYPGTGLGLAICKKIVERHGGRIWVESTPGQGSTFRFTLPAAD